MVQSKKRGSQLKLEQEPSCSYHKELQQSGPTLCQNMSDRHRFLTPPDGAPKLTPSVYHLKVKTCTPFLCELPRLLHTLQQRTHIWYQEQLQTSVLCPSPVPPFIPCFSDAEHLRALWLFCDWSLHPSIPCSFSFNDDHPFYSATTHRGQHCHLPQ